MNCMNFVFIADGQRWEQQRTLAFSSVSHWKPCNTVFKISPLEFCIDLHFLLLFPQFTFFIALSLTGQGCTRRHSSTKLLSTRWWPSYTSQRLQRSECFLSFVALLFVLVKTCWLFWSWVIKIKTCVFTLSSRCQSTMGLRRKFLFEFRQLVALLACPQAL